jgi:hypothetical protein
MNLMENHIKIVVKVKFKNKPTQILSKIYKKPYEK